MPQSTLTIAIFGAAGATGAKLVTQAAAAGHKVRAIEHSWPQKAPDTDLVTHHTADVLKDDLSNLIDGTDAVVSALGVGNDLPTLINPPPLYTEGTLRIVQGMKAVDVRRLVVISASFVEAKDRGPLHFRIPAMLSLHRVFTQMGDMERILRVTDDIDWTAVRPGWLMDGDLTEDYTVTDNVIPPKLIRTRHADLAHFILRCITDGSHVRETPAIARAEPPEATSPMAVLREMA
ncbi:NAD(P)-dependent oxidoreductase [Litoreibacter roseus]|uniref:NAD(P)-binding domain-containing protein n=1 Tax=Litoreibacter roseus TaxID=2601869 RepID=A0A6N6JJK5_9RHOB|nr:NAD(P)H-binding protein [Litoreibacter roseus]GFE66020.1 hypothetical protein KIN_30940 [Litoreibacter roseus]